MCQYISQEIEPAAFRPANQNTIPGFMRRVEKVKPACRAIPFVRR
jgi:hypothetical protein